jgi:plasmid maintenance system killer protein
MSDNITELYDCSPEKIAKIIFAEEPKDPLTRRLKLDDNKYNVIYIFEILITILMEGFQIITNNFESVDFNEFTKNSITYFEPWFNSLGFKLCAFEYDKDIDADFYDKYYCKAIIKNKLTETLFIIKNITKSYHFFINGDNLLENKKHKDLDKLYAIFINNDKVYKIYFDFMKLA